MVDWPLRRRASKEDTPPREEKPLHAYAAPFGRGFADRNQRTERGRPASPVAAAAYQAGIWRSLQAMQHSEIVISRFLFR